MSRNLKIVLAILMAITCLLGCSTSKVAKSKHKSKLKTAPDHSEEKAFKPTFIKLEGGESITIGSPIKKLHRHLGNPVLTNDSGDTTVWILADGTEISIKDGVVVSIGFSEDAKFNEIGAYKHQKVRHHGGVQGRPALNMNHPVTVREHLRRLPSGRYTVVRQHTRNR